MNTDDREETAGAAALRARLRHVHRIGGGCVCRAGDAGVPL
ncbi:hypothetical protein [Actinomadura macra]|nr:hypothetical protein [Actinomadura macra]